MKKASGGNWLPSGHLAGGKFLQEIAAKVDQSVREIDFLTRFGSDEFAIILPYTQKENEVAVALRIRLAIENCTTTVNDQSSLTLSMIISVAEYAP